jgi:hypothetical protein
MSMNLGWLTLMAVCSTFSASAALTLSSKGKTDYRIVIATNAIPSEHYAAEELRHYLGKITGAEFTITNESQKSVKREILVGNSTRLAARPGR